MPSLADNNYNGVYERDVPAGSLKVQKLIKKNKAYDTWVNRLQKSRTKEEPKRNETSAVRWATQWQKHARNIIIVWAQCMAFMCTNVFVKYKLLCDVVAGNMRNITTLYIYSVFSAAIGFRSVTAESVKGVRMNVRTRRKKIVRKKK